MDQTGIKSTEYTSQQVKSYKEGDFDYLNQLRQEVLSYSEKRERIIISGEKPTTITTYLDDFYQIPTYKETDGYKHRITRPKGEVLITKREEKWAEILVPQLLKTTQPICIAVGVAHVVGKDNLSDRFAKAGFKVELITPKHRSRL
jgi:uncharacterized protein YbaP (TraB family)